MTLTLLATLVYLLFGLIQTILVCVITYIFRQIERSNAEFNTKIAEINAKIAEVNASFDETVKMIYHDVFSHRHTKPDEEVFIPGKYQK